MCIYIYIYVYTHCFSLKPGHRFPTVPAAADSFADNTRSSAAAVLTGTVDFSMTILLLAIGARYGYGVRDYECETE